jgi:hypothetical protein
MDLESGQRVKQLERKQKHKKRNHDKFPFMDRIKFGLSGQGHIAQGNNRTSKLSKEYHKRKIITIKKEI